VFDAGSVHFARSTDYGVTWSSVFTLGGQAPQIADLAPADQYLFRSPLNDDDGNRFLPFNMDLQDEVVSGQALPELHVDANGNIMALWYDTRRDVADHRLDVFATISTDGGMSFSANHRVTQLSFDPSAGMFTDARGAASYYLGDRLGLGIAADGTVFAAWSDTQAGNQDIAFGKSVLSPPPAVPNDRYEPNETPAQPTDLGSITVPRTVPRLVMVGGENDWFRFTAGAIGTLTVTVTASTGGDSLLLDLWDGAGTTMLAVGQSVAGGQQVIFTVSPGPYQLRARKQPSGAIVAYTLTLEIT
jgi:hypothetical protein